MAPFLLALSPRAKSRRNIILVQKNTLHTDTYIEKIIEPIAYDLEQVISNKCRMDGDSFIACWQNVEQPSNTNSKTVRIGKEALILANVSVQKLSKNDKEELFQALEKWLPSLAVLVTKEIDWDNLFHESSILRHQNLNIWYRNLVKSVKPLRSFLLRRRVTRGVLFFILISAIFWMIFNFQF